MTDRDYRLEFVVLYRKDLESGSETGFVKAAQDEPVVALRKFGLDVPKDRLVKFCVDRKDLTHIVMPAPATDAEYLDINLAPMPPQLVHRYHDDPQFAQKMTSDPITTPNEAGFRFVKPLAEGEKIQLMVDSDEVMHFVIPRLGDTEVYEEQAERGKIIWDRYESPKIVNDMYFIWDSPMFVDRFDGNLVHKTGKINLSMIVQVDKTGCISFETKILDDDFERKLAGFYDGNDIKLKCSSRLRKLSCKSVSVRFDRQGGKPKLVPHAQVVINGKCSDNSRDEVSVYLSNLNYYAFPKKENSISTHIDDPTTIDEREPRVIKPEDYFYPVEGLGMMFTADKGYWHYLEPEHTGIISVSKENPEEDWEKRAIEFLSNTITAINFAQGGSASSCIWEISRGNAIATKISSHTCSMAKHMPVIQSREDASKLMQCVIDKQNDEHWPTISRAIRSFFEGGYLNEAGLNRKLASIESVARCLSNFEFNKGDARRSNCSPQGCVTRGSNRFDKIVGDYISLQKDKLGTNMFPEFGKTKLSKLKTVRDRLAHTSDFKDNNETWEQYKKRLIRYTVLSHELFVRMILSYLGYEGRYCSYIDEQGNLGGTGARIIEEDEIRVEERNIECLFSLKEVCSKERRILEQIEAEYPSGS